MSAPIGPGDDARCVNARPHADTGEVLLVVGRIYRVIRLFGDELVAQKPRLAVVGNKAASADQAAA